jgi:diadenosine tetraphosphate (Ap4A) HIT family hydrolase
MTEAAHRKPECPFCYSNNLFKGKVIAQSSGGYVAENEFSPGNYLIIPVEHVETPLELSDTWWAEVKILLRRIPGLAEHYNVSLNVGSQAGQTVKHLHFWVVPRARDKPSSGKGLARLISEADAVDT